MSIKDVLRHIESVPGTVSIGMGTIQHFRKKENRQNGVWLNKVAVVVRENPRQLVYKYDFSWYLMQEVKK